MKNKIIDSLTFLVLFLFLVIFIPKALAFALGSDYPIAAIASDSMWPNLKKGDIVFIEGVDLDELKIGDIVVYKTNKNFIIHRIIEKNKNNLITKGDANESADLPIGYENIVGKALVLEGKAIRIPYLGNISIAIKAGLDAYSKNL